MSILELFCDVDDFCQWVSRWEDAKLYGLTGKRGPAPRLSMSEVMTILIHFHQLTCPQRTGPGIMLEMGRIGGEIARKRHTPKQVVQTSGAGQG